VDNALIPTGELKPVEGTPFDFRKPTAVGARINADNEQIKFGSGYDHNWVVNKPLGKLGLVARVTDPTTGRVMEVLSTEPGVQFYTGNFLDGSITGKGGWVYQKRNGLCFEPQHYPDSPNHPQFPSAELKPGETYQNTILYRSQCNHSCTHLSTSEFSLWAILLPTRRSARLLMPPPTTSPRHPWLED